MSQELAKYETTGEVSPYTSPQQEVDRAHKMAKVLQDVVKQARLSKAFTKGGKEHLFFEAWQTIGRFFNCAPEIEWSRPLTHNDKIIGWEARAIVRNTNGQTIASAESMCAKDEDNWKNRPAYAIRSMAQTRASSKALRQAFAWVAVLAGYAATPAEEMDGVETKPEPPQQEPPKNEARQPEPQQEAKPQHDDDATPAQKKKLFAMSAQRFGDRESGLAFIRWALEQTGQEYWSKSLISSFFDEFDSQSAAYEQEMANS